MTMMRAGLFMAALLTLVACGAFVENDVHIVEKSATQLSFLTLNAGMDSTTVLNYADRKKELPQALYDTGADIVCLQGVWKEADQKELAANLKEVFPYKYYKVTKPTDTEPQPAPCTESDLTPMAMCYLQNCAETDASDVVAIGLCLATSCLAEITGIPADCRNCLIGAITGGAGDIMGIMAECTGQQDAVEMAQGGNNGLMLLSKLQLKNAKLEAFNSFYYQRAYLRATVNHPAFGEVEILCTHLTDAVPGMPYAGSGGSWQGELAAQAQELIDLPAPKGSAFRVLMGDLATGPAIGRDIKGKNPSVYDLFYYAYYYDPFVELENAAPQCTLCADNPLSAAETQDSIPDHILLTMPLSDRKISVRRILDEPLILTDKAGKTKTTRYSDHYGVMVTLER